MCGTTHPLHKLFGMWRGAPQKGSWLECQLPFCSRTPGATSKSLGESTEQREAYQAFTREEREELHEIMWDMLIEHHFGASEGNSPSASGPSGNASSSDFAINQPVNLFVKVPAPPTSPTPSAAAAE